MPSKIFNNRFFRIVVLLIAGWAFAATSKLTSDGVISFGTYVLSSDCVSPALSDLVIEVSGEEVISPDGDSFTDYGFPTSTVSVTNDNTGPVGSVQRRCTTSYGSDELDDSVWIFSCFDDEAYSCSIVMRE